MSNKLKDFIEQQFVISKLKKEAKVLHRENPQYTLMECQNQIAKQHGYLHWHELYTVIKKRLEKQQFSNHISMESTNNFLLGNDLILKKKIYLEPFFKYVNIEKNTHTNDFSFNLFKEIILKDNSKFIYCNTEKNVILKNNIEQYAQNNQIPLYYLSFTEENKKETLGLNFSTFFSGALTELFCQLMFQFEDDDANFWKGRAVSFASSILMALVYMRDTGEIKLTPNTIRDSLILDNVLKLYYREDFPTHIHSAIKSYLFALPAFNINLDKQSDSTYEMHGYLQMQFTRVLGFMIDFYQNVFNENTISLLSVLKKQEKFILIVNFPDFEKFYDLENFFHIFMYYFKHSFIDYTINKNSLNYSTYLLLESMPEFNLNLPAKYNYVPVNYIFLDNKFSNEGIHIIPEKDNQISIK